MKYKFRGLNGLTPNRKWVYGSCIEFCEYGCSGILEVDNKENPKTVNWLVDTKTIGQFTTLSDKNGKEIYEGDIIKFDSELNLLVVFGYRGAWMLSDGMNWQDTYLVDHLDLEVIGNVHENPELIKRIST